MLESELLIKDQGIEILVEMAQKGTIDPWNIDIIDVTDKYLATLEGRSELDLRLSGRALLYAAILLRLKSECLEEPEVCEDFDVDEDQEEARGSRPSLTVLDGLVRRRTSNKQPRTRPITLVELIEELARLEKLSALSDPSPTDNVRRRSAPSTRSLAHEEDLEGDIRRLHSILNQGLENGGQVTFSGLMGEEQDGQDRPGVYLALIFLDSRGLIRLEQERFYGEITIRADEGNEGNQKIEEKRKDLAA